MWISTLSPRLANPLYDLCTFLVSLHELEPLASHCAGVLREGICASFPAFRGKHQPLLLITVLRVLFTNIFFIKLRKLLSIPTFLGVSKHE